MSKKNWIAPEGCSYVIDTEAEASESERKHYGGCVVAESIYHEGDMELILAAPGQADRIAELEALDSGDFDPSKRWLDMLAKLKEATDE